MSSSLLIVAALYELMSNGNSLFAEKSSLIDACSNSNKNSFTKFYSTISDSSMTVSATKQSDYINRIITKLPIKFPDMIKSQADDVLQQFKAAQDSKFWESNGNASVISSHYSPEEKMFRTMIWTATPVTNNEKLGYRNQEFSCAVSYNYPNRFQTTVFSDGNTASQSSTLLSSSSTETQIEKALGALELTLLPFTLVNNNERIQQWFTPLVNAAIKEIDSGNLPYLVTEENKATVKENLQELLNKGFNININDIQQQVNQKCK